jgi:hypothetical protein
VLDVDRLAGVEGGIDGRCKGGVVGHGPAVLLMVGKGDTGFSPIAPVPGRTEAGRSYGTRLFPSAA